MVARVEKPIGFCQFLAKLEQADGSLRDVTVLVRGKFKGGKNCPARVETGCFVMVEGDIKRTLEVVGVVNRQSELDKLRKSGRISEKLAGEEHALDELFDYSAEDEEAEALKAKAKKAEKESMTDVLIAKYKQRAAAGEKLKEELCLRETGAPALDTSFEVEEEDGAAGPMRRRKRKVVGPTAGSGAAAAAVAPTETEQAEAEVYDFAASIQRRSVPKSWEDDEIDIDAI